MNPCNSSTRGPFSLAKGVDSTMWLFLDLTCRPLLAWFFTWDTPAHELTLWTVTWNWWVSCDTWGCEFYLILNNSRVYYIHIYTHDTFTSGWLKYPDWSETQIEAMMVLVCFASQTCKNETWADLNKYRFIGSKLSKVRQKIKISPYKEWAFPRRF